MINPRLFQTHRDIVVIAMPFLEFQRKTTEYAVMWILSGTFIINLPILQEIMSSDNQRVMVVDDGPNILTVLEIFLKKREYKIDMFSSSLQALEYLRKTPLPVLSS